ncbi:hypothetical protein JTB14_023228 [Gonioctena quinquepunctata]|nr:hypothetical protein JTB14_023228 [Gonioctena quinquepunctata]
MARGGFSKNSIHSGKLFNSNFLISGKPIYSSTEEPKFIAVGRRSRKKTRQAQEQNQNRQTREATPGKKDNGLSRNIAVSNHLFITRLLADPKGNQSQIILLAKIQSDSTVNN